MNKQHAFKSGHPFKINGSTYKYNSKGYVATKIRDDFVFCGNVEHCNQYAFDVVGMLMGKRVQVRVYFEDCNFDI